MSTAQSERTKTDHATYDASNPANLEPGVLCRVLGGSEERAWKFYASVANRTGAVKMFQVKDQGGGVVFYDVPANSTVQIQYAAGNNASSRAFRLHTAQSSGLAGYVSAEGLGARRVLCISCDNDADGPAACSARIPE